MELRLGALSGRALLYLGARNSLRLPRRFRHE